VGRGKKTGGVYRRQEKGGVSGEEAVPLRAFTKKKKKKKKKKEKKKRKKKKRKKKKKKGKKKSSEQA